MKLALLDRDGVLNEDRTDYVKHPGELVLIPRAAEACARLNSANIKVAIVSNQGGVGKGVFSQEMLNQIHGKLHDELKKAGAKIDLLLTCTEPPWSDHERRKPGPGMLREALTHFRTTPQDAFMVGDQLRDLQAAKALNIRRLLVRTGKGADLQAKGLPDDILPVSVYDDLYAAVEAVLREP
ncbi:MAG: HAD-IIIA family hydrolase [Micropepsaceae bacterium]